MSNGACPICGGPVTKETRVSHLNVRDQAHVHLYEAFCESCQIMLKRNIAGEHDTGWFASSVDLQDIIGELSHEEISKVANLLARYPTLFAKWQEFIAQKRETDIVCRFKQNDSTYTGLTIKRGSRLIGRFEVWRSL